MYKTEILFNFSFIIAFILSFYYIILLRIVSRIICVQNVLPIGWNPWICILWVIQTHNWVIHLIITSHLLSINKLDRNIDSQCSYRFTCRFLFNSFLIFVKFGQLIFSLLYYKPRSYTSPLLYNSCFSILHLYRVVLLA